MSFLGKGKKDDLVLLASELREVVPPGSKVIDIKGIIMGSKVYDEVLVKEMLDNIIEDRKQREKEIEREREKEEREKERQRESEERDKQREHEIRIRELEARGRTKEDNEGLSGSGDGSEGTGKTFLGYFNIMKGVVWEPPGRAEEWPFFFRHAETMFKLYEIPEKYQGKIILHALKGRARGLSVVLDGENLDNYAKIKEALLKEYQITPLQHKRNWDGCSKRPGESYSQYAVRVEAALDLYLQSREVTEFQKLKDLWVADKIKDNLPQNVKSHICLKEVEGWFPVGELTKEIDNFMTAVPGYRGGSSSNFKAPSSQNYRWEKTVQEDKFKERKEAYGREVVRPGKKGWESGKRKDEQGPTITPPKNAIKCFKCQKEGHLKRFCPQVNQISQSHEGEHEGKLEEKGLNKICVEANDLDHEFGGVAVGDVEGDLPRIDLTIGEKHFRGVVDSGAQITVLREALVPEQYLESAGKILLRPAVGPPVKAKLVTVPISLRVQEGEIQPVISVNAAVVRDLNEIALITPQVVRLLKEQWSRYLGEEGLGKDSQSEGVFIVQRDQESSQREDQEEQIITTPVDNEGNLAIDKGVKVDKSTQQGKKEQGKEVDDRPLTQSQQFRKEQRECPELKKLLVGTQKTKNRYWLEDGMLYHTGVSSGQKISQLVVPVTRRKEILRLAHEMLTGGHLGAKKTRQRIAMSFWWEGMRKDVAKWCESCHGCQMRRKNKVNDRAPIEAVVRPELPFQVVNADILGPVEPKSSRGHRYVLCIMDQHSRWPEAVPLRTLTAKSTCEAFIEVFMRTGVPQTIAMDNGTNFAANLTKEFLARLGVTPRFSTPGYPQSNGLVERFIGTMKAMLHHAIEAEGRSWDKQLPYLLWAYREVPNATTGVAPFLLVYGREPTGPLAILRSSWEEEGVLPQGVGKSVSDYLRALKGKIKEAVDFAEKQTAGQQDKYVRYHNVKSTDREFAVGDEVVVLIPTSTNKLCSKWTGPGQVVRVKSPHSFLVKLPDGSVRHLHQNKIRKYIQPVSAVGLIYEADEDFGEVQHAPVGKRGMLEEYLRVAVSSKDWMNLEGFQKKQLAGLIREFGTVFNGEVKCAKVGSHVIRLKPGVERKQPHVYKVPEAVKPQVEKQIDELLARGLIEPSTAEIAYPIVCVAKKDGTVRLCCDYRGLNSESKIVPFPMQNSEELRFKAGAAHYLTTLDILKGYWEIPLEKESRELTSFVSPKGQYQWRVMPFGLSGAAATFQRIMNQALRPHAGYAESFIDDIIVFSENWESHIKHLRAVLNTLETLNFSANLEKCSFAKPQVKYLGHVVGSGKHGPDPDKVAVIKNLKVPKTKKALRSVLGLINYYREYVPGYAGIARPLTELTKKSVSNAIPWPKEAEQAFRELKEALCRAVFLHTPDLGKPFEIHTDASATGIGACLLQRNEGGKAMPIIFISQKLTPAQAKWSTIEREAYAVIWALGKFEIWTYGQKIMLQTDHNPLKYLTEGVPRNARLQRWALALPRFNVSITHRPGSANADADALSRLDSE